MTKNNNPLQKSIQSSYNKINLQPHSQYMVFPAQSSIDVKVLPSLHSSFLELGGNLLLHGHKQYISVPFKHTISEANRAYAISQTSRTVIEVTGSFCASDNVIHGVLPLRHPVLLALNQRTDQQIQSASLILSLASEKFKSIKSISVLQVYLNNQLLGEITNKHYDGRYHFSVPVTALYDQSSGEIIKNNIFQLVPVDKTQTYKTYSCNVVMFLEHHPIDVFLVASSLGQAQKIARQSESSLLNTNVDLVLVNNDWSLPTEMFKNKETQCTVEIFNASTKQSPPCQLVASVGGKIIGQLAVPVINSFDSQQMVLPIQLPSDIKADDTTDVTIKVVVENDTIPDDNVLRFTLSGKAN